MQNFRITAQSDRRNCRDNAGCIFTGAVHRTMAVSAVGESAERNRFAERESGCDLDLAGRRFDNRDTFGTLPGFLQHLVQSGPRDPGKFRKYPYRETAAHRADCNTVHGHYRLYCSGPAHSPARQVSEKPRSRLPATKHPDNDRIVENERTTGRIRRHAEKPFRHR